MAAKRTPLELFKFSVYILLPIGTIAVFNQPEFVKKLIETREYIIYPPEHDRPPVGTKSEIEARLSAMRVGRSAAAPNAGAEQPVTADAGPGAEPAGERKKWLGIW